MVSDLDKNKNSYSQFLRLWIGQNFSFLGSEVVGFAITWWITDITKNVLYLSLMMLLTFVPRLFLSPIAGAWADKYNRKIILISADALQAVFTFILIILLLILPAKVWLVIIFNTIRAIFQAIHGPSYNAVVPSMVPREKLSKFNGLNQLFQSIIGLGAPVIGALVYGKFGLAHTLWVDIITFFIAFALLLTVSIPNPHLELKDTSMDQSLKKNSKISIMESIKEGFQTIRKIPGLIPMILILAMTNFLLTPFNTLATYIINVVHGGNATDMALVSVFLQLGLILGSITVSLKKEWKHKALMITIAMMFIWIGISLFAIVPQGNFLLLGAAGFIITFLLPISITLMITQFQITVPKDKMGRAMSFMTVLNSAGLLLGYLISGPLASLIGAVALIISAGVIGLIFSICMYYFSSIRQIDKTNHSTPLNLESSLDMELITEKDNNTEKVIVEE